jgi:pyruvate dehydrogenase E2 component (dihydrolipoamide acetyltransferase)
MPFWYYFSVPKLPPEIAHQSNLVEIRKYLASEGSRVEVGSPIALVENHWAVITLKANGKGILKKTFFDRGASVKIGDPIAIIGADGECIPHGTDLAVLEVTEHKRSKPMRDKGSA